MQKRYLIRNVEQSNICLKSDLWDNSEIAKIDCVSWKEWDYKPNTTACILAGNKGITIKFITDETPYVQYHKYNDPTHKDSCVELFLNASPDNDDRYMNFELNAEGTLHLGFGKNRSQRNLIWDVDINDFDIQAETTQNGWQVKFFIPFSFLNKYYKSISKTFTGNMYKCGDMTPRPHFVSWSSINAEKPDFHRPECFGTIVR